MKSPLQTGRQWGITQPGGRRTRPRIMKGKKILILDDDPVVVKALGIKLQQRGYTVLTATNAESALRTVRTETPDLLIVDIHLPGSPIEGPEWSGFTLVQWLERLYQDWRRPVIIISADEPAKHREATQRVGAVGYFQKPVDHDALLAAVASALNPSEPAET